CAIQRGKEALRTEGTEEMGKDGMDVAEPHRGIRRIRVVCAHLESRPRGEENDATRGIGVEEVRRQIVGCREGIRYAVPVDFPASIRKRSADPVVGPEKR